MAANRKPATRPAVGRKATARPLGSDGGRKKVEELPREVRRFIVQRLARFDSPSEVAVAVKEEYGLEVSRQRVAHYDPEHGRDVAEEWIELHAATRAEFIRDVSRVGLAHQVVRLVALDQIYRRAVGKGNDVLALQVLEQAAKERGGAYTSRRELTGRDGMPLTPPVLNIMTTIDPKTLSDEQLERLVAGDSIEKVLGLPR